MKEPSQWARDASEELFVFVSKGAFEAPEVMATHNARVIQVAIDNALSEPLAERDAAIMAAYKKDARIAQLESLLADTMKTSSLYINVPELIALRQRWDELKPK